MLLSDPTLRYFERAAESLTSQLSSPSSSWAPFLSARKFNEFTSGAGTTAYGSPQRRPTPGGQQSLLRTPSPLKQQANGLVAKQATGLAALVKWGFVENWIPSSDDAFLVALSKQTAANIEVVVISDAPGGESNKNARPSGALRTEGLVVAFPGLSMAEAHRVTLQYSSAARKAAAEAAAAAKEAAEAAAAVAAAAEAAAAAAAAATAAAAAAAEAAKPSDTLSVNSALRPGEFLLSTSGRYKAIMQADGNLCVYAIYEGGRMEWRYGTKNLFDYPANADGSGTEDGQWMAVMQADGNLTVTFTPSTDLSDPQFKFGTIQVSLDRGNSPPPPKA